MNASFRAWADDLASWHIPDSITSQVSESPWVLPDEVFSRRAERYLAAPGGPSYDRALEALGAGGSVLDVGAGGGAASLPLAAHITQLTAVDAHQPMLDDLVRRAERLGLAATAVRGIWPQVDVPVADVVLCHHVVYNVADLAPFITALTAHARRRVVVELTVRHPLTELNPYWKEFHGLDRPAGPTAEQALDLLRGLDLPVQFAYWTRPEMAEYDSFDTLVDVTRRRLCLPPERAGEVAAALLRDGAEPGFPQDLGSSGREIVTVWWPGTAVQA